MRLVILAILGLHLAGLAGADNTRCDPAPGLASLQGQVLDMDRDRVSTFFLVFSNSSGFDNSKCSGSSQVNHIIFDGLDGYQKTYSGSEFFVFRNYDTGEKIVISDDRGSHTKVGEYWFKRVDVIDWSPGAQIDFSNGWTCRQADEDFYVHQICKAD